MTAAEYRKNKDTMVVAGTGVIAFGAWYVIKVLMLLLNNQEILKEVFAEELKEVSMTTIWIVIGILLAGLCSFNLYVGLAARGEGMGKRKRPFRGLAIFLTLTHFSSAVFSVIDALTDAAGNLEILVSALLDIMGFYVFVELLIAAYRIKKQSKLGEDKIVTVKAG